MRTKCIFQINAQVANNSGDGSENYSELCTCFGRFKKRNGMKKNDSGELVLQEGYELVVRFQQAIFQNINSDLRVQIANTEKFYFINSVTIIDEDKPHWLQFIVDISYAQPPA